MPKLKKTLSNTNAADVVTSTPDVKFFGNPDTFKLISKASSENEGWMKSTKAMQVPGGCVIQVSTQQAGHVAEALTFVPNVAVVELHDGGHGFEEL